MKFTDALDRKLEEIERPSNLPAGNYIWTSSKHPEIDEFTSKAGDPFSRVTFMLQCVNPSDDVDPDELEEYGNVAGAMNRKVFLFNESEAEKQGFERGMFQLRNFLEHCGLSPDMPLNEALAASVGTQFLGELKFTPSRDDPEVIYTEVNRTAPL
jgi:hypothetical protein